jgi:hypothetical protein
MLAEKIRRLVSPPFAAHFTGAAWDLGLVCVTASCTGPLDLGTDIIWATDVENETGTFSAWSGPPGTGGPYFESGSPAVSVSSDQAHSGHFSLKLTSTATTEAQTSSLPAGVGLLKEAQFPEEAYYSAWYYLPSAYQTLTSWTIMKFESPLPAESSDGGSSVVDAAAEASAPSDGGVTPPVSDGGAAAPPLMQLLDLRLQSLPGGDMALVVYDHRQQYLEAPLADPVPTVPVGRWFQLECFYRNAGDSSGRLTVWLDGLLVYDLSRPMGASPTIGFTPCSLADDLIPSAVELYLDDIAISWRRVTPSGVLTLPN